MVMLVMLVMLVMGRIKHQLFGFIVHNTQFVKQSNTDNRYENGNNADDGLVHIAGLIRGLE